MPGRKLLVYIHGFLSSPLSLKAEEARNFLAKTSQTEFLAPQLSNYPDLAFDQLVQLIETEKSRFQNIGLIGSSLGGFYATALAERFNLRAALVNPAVNPAEHRFIDRYQGEQLNPYTNEYFTLEEKHRQALADIYSPVLSQPENLWLMVQTADEILDYREAVEYYRASKQLIEEGGDHRFQRFERHLPAIMDFLFYGHESDL
jgi:predicted esterase YcpF (UPF0227 family)